MLDKQGYTRPVTHPPTHMLELLVPDRFIFFFLTVVSSVGLQWLLAVKIYFLHSVSVVTFFKFFMAGL
jgi:hypothetical protein